MKGLSIQTNNLRLSALSWGVETDPPVIALHGWLDNAASFIPIAEHLTGIHLVALDLPGHGKSEHRQGVNAYHYIDYAADVILAADALGCTKFSLLGHSLGAGVAGVVAAVTPERVERLAMIEGLAPLTASPENMVKQLQRHIDQIVKAPKDAKPYQTIDEAAQARKRAGDLSLPSALLIAERNLLKNENGFVWRTDRCLRKASPMYLAEEHVKCYLQKIQCDSLLIRSSDGIIKNWDSLRGREIHLPNLTVVDIDGGHHCHMDDPGKVAKPIVSFLDHCA